MMNGRQQPTPEQVLQHGALVVAQLMTHATRDQSLEAKLAPINDRSVEVYLVDFGIIATTSRHNAFGCVFSEPHRYLIFCDEGGAPGMPADFTAQQRRRYVVLEEFAHALHGDVYTDDPAAMLARTPKEWDLAEACARGYAAERFATELVASGQPDLARSVIEQKCLNSWVLPSDAAYLRRYPSLSSERSTW